MSSICESSNPPRVFIDTTVLCGTIRADGINRKILKAARFPNLYIPVVSKVCLFEFVRNAAKGLGGAKYTHEEIEGFLSEFLWPIFHYYNDLPVNSVVGRYSVETIMREHLSIGEVLVELSGCSSDTAMEIVASHGMSEPLTNFDQDDFHVWVTAIQNDCDYIMTANNRRFPSQIGKIQRIHPKDFFARFLE